MIQRWVGGKPFFLISRWNTVCCVSQINWISILFILHEANTQTKKLKIISNHTQTHTNPKGWKKMIMKWNQKSIFNEINSTDEWYK